MSKLPSSPEKRAFAIDSEFSGIAENGSMFVLTRMIDAPEGTDPAVAIRVLELTEDASSVVRVFDNVETDIELTGSKEIVWLRDNGEGGIEQQTPLQYLMHTIGGSLTLGSMGRQAAGEQRLRQLTDQELAQAAELNTFLQK